MRTRQTIRNRYETSEPGVYACILGKGARVSPCVAVCVRVRVYAVCVR